MRCNMRRTAARCRNPHTYKTIKTRPIELDTHGRRSIHIPGGAFFPPPSPSPSPHCHSKPNAIRRSDARSEGRNEMRTTMVNMRAGIFKCRLYPTHPRTTLARARIDCVPEMRPGRRSRAKVSAHARVRVCKNALSTECGRTGRRVHSCTTERQP